MKKKNKNLFLLIGGVGIIWLVSLKFPAFALAIDPEQLKEELKEELKKILPKNREDWEDLQRKQKAIAELIERLVGLLFS